jgi:hypothetical protein
VQQVPAWQNSAYTAHYTRRWQHRKYRCENLRQSKTNSVAVVVYKRIIPTSLLPLVGEVRGIIWW